MSKRLTSEQRKDLLADTLFELSYLYDNTQAADFCDCVYKADTAITDKLYRIMRRSGRGRMFTVAQQMFA